MARLFDTNSLSLLFRFYLLVPIIFVNTIQIPFIDNVILKASNSSGITKFVNGSCCECIYSARSFSYMAVNCFPNNTCQFFLKFPLTYRIVDTSYARLYFPQLIYPNTSQCCMSNTTQLINILKAANRTHTNVTSPRDIIIDDYGYLATLERDTKRLDRFNPTNLTKISYHPTFTNGLQWTVGYFKGNYYVAGNSTQMSVIDGQNFTSISNISNPVFGVRDMIFLNDGQLLVLVNFDDNTLKFFNRTSLTSVNYKLSFSQNTSCPGPHGAWRVNDSFFYVTCYNNRELHSFTAPKNYGNWTEHYVFL